MVSSRSAYVFLVLSVATLALILRFHNLGYESLFMDEIAQVQFYGAKPLEMIKLAAVHMQPPLDYWVGSFFFLFSQSDFTARLPAALFGTFSVILFILLAAKLTSRKCALFFGLLMALSPFHVYYSQEVRPYSITMFFLFVLLVVLEALYRRDEKNVLRYILLFVVSLLFLLTRALAPLLIVLLIILFSLLYVCGLKIKLIHSEHDGSWRKHVVISSILSLAVLGYLPFFLNILKGSQRYVNAGADISLQMIVEGLQRFNPFLIWRSYVFTVEPFEWIFLALTCVAILAIIRERLKKGHLVMVLIAFLFISTPLLHLLIFQTKSDYDFRPPYAIYFFPLAFLISSYGLHSFFEWSKRKVSQPWPAFIVVIVMLGLLVPQVMALADFKTRRIKSDWRGVCQYLDNTFGGESLFIFETLATQKAWDPQFWGFPKYYKGQSLGLSLQKFAANFERLKNYPAQPVLILFRYKNCFLHE